MVNLFVNTELIKDKSNAYLLTSRILFDPPAD